jgi:hypothetical protein
VVGPGHNLAADGHEYFLALVVHSKHGLLRQFVHVGHLAQWSQGGIHQPVPNDVMVVKLVFGQLRQLVEGQKQGAAYQRLGGFLRINVFQLYGRFVALQAQRFHEVGHELSFKLNKDRIEAFVRRRVVYVEYQHHLPFVAVKLGDVAKFKTILNFHAERE